MKPLFLALMLMAAGMAWAESLHTVDNYCVNYGRDKDCNMTVEMSRYPDPNTICEIILAAEGVLPYLESFDKDEDNIVRMFHRIRDDMRLNGTPEWLKEEEAKSVSRKAAISRFRDAVKKGREGR